MQKKLPSLQVFSVVVALFLSFALFNAPVYATEATPLLQGAMKDFTLQPTPKQWPDAVFKDVAGKPVKLSSFHGKLVLLTLWATWCPYCAQELPGLSDLQAMMDPTKFMVLPISIDKEGARIAKKYLEEKSINLPTYADPKTEVSLALETHGIPFSVLLDKDGREIGRVHGQTDWMAPESIALIKAYIK
ncbi:MAG: TlpA family protein disulfide reductase [Alphaproteobacteria bacterium]|nr:TlpA family protein disulfide reductase [Alphaproteobacteria bacterium]